MRIIATKEKSLVYYPRPNRVRWSPRGRKLLASPPRKQQLGSPCSFYLPASAQQVREGHSWEDVTWHTAMRWVMKNKYLKRSKRSHHIRIWMKKHFMGWQKRISIDYNVWKRDKQLDISHIILLPLLTNWISHLFCGSIAGTVQRTFLFPMLSSRLWLIMIRAHNLDDTECRVIAEFGVNQRNKHDFAYSRTDIDVNGQQRRQ